MLISKEKDTVRFLSLFPYDYHSSLSGIFQKDCGYPNIGHRQAAMTDVYATLGRSCIYVKKR